MLSGRHILLGVSGGIAAYKIPELVRLYRKAGAEVRVTTTRNALQFVTETTLRTLSGNPVYSDVFAPVNEHSTEHISLPDWADILVVAPATANLIGKAAAGIADDALTTTLAATLARKPLLIAPAMNDKMYDNPATRDAMRRLASWGVTVLDCADGFLACGTEGKGRMQEPAAILEATKAALTPQTMRGKRVLLTAGPTREKLDPVRYLTNYSSGKMGYAIARACLRRGAEVVLVTGPVSQLIEPVYAGKLQLVSVESAAQMADAAVAEWGRADMAVLSAAVADFTPQEVSATKRKKQQGQTGMTLQLTTTQDIAAALGASKRNGQLLVGFALETDNEHENALKKLRSKNLDLIALNSLKDSGAGFGVDTNVITLITARGAETKLPLLTKEAAADAILASCGF
ncbi:MAG: bifunctional phosphopantothenoylcysteine decarboxylase/phosphopantothenate--cysteine ligase CoaBC [Paludibacteraceae bacterium]|nr:bifunctional phosphopantothenoylcysteine decarboxylase/phosphopantothenate--cysteine ligase CoaBC [Paludibacteraceae bacterium]